MNVTLELIGLPSQNTTVEFLRLEAGVAIVKNEHDVETGESRFRLCDGRSVDEDNKPTAWNFWRLSKRDCRRLRELVK